MLSGFGLVLGPVDLDELVLLLLSGTGAAARKDGFLCVICDGSTFLSPDVTFSPLFN